jgi:hypothetical protein
VDSFCITFDGNTNHILRDFNGQSRGTIELGDSLLGWWSEANAVRGWVAAGGQLTIPNFRFEPEQTIEMWFRLLDVPKDGVPLLHFAFDGTVMDSTWLNRERGGPMAVMFPDSSIGLHFHEFGDANADLPGIFELGRWYRLAWVRMGGLHRIYVNSKEVLSLYLPKYGDRVLGGLQLNVAQNADHDWILEWGRKYMEVRSIRAVPRALESGQFMELNFPWSETDENGVPYRFSLGSYHINPFSPSYTIKLNLPQGYEKGLVIELLDREQKLLRSTRIDSLQPGHREINFFQLFLKDHEYESGVYILRVIAGGESRMREFVILR